MKLRITVALILVIALQSLVGVIDASRPHHPAVFHEGHDHQLSSVAHSHDTELNNFATTGQAKNVVADFSEYDMDHVSDHCHLNHVHFHILPVSAAADTAATCSSQILPDVQSGQPSSTPRTPFRPPIA